MMKFCKLEQTYIDAHKKGYEEGRKELEAQIEKMKNCRNCKNWNWKHCECAKKLKGDCFKNSKWELAE